MHAVALFLYMTEILCMCFLVVQAFFIRMQHDVVFCDTSGYLLLSSQENRLRNVVDITYLLSTIQLFAEPESVFLAHAIEQEVGTAVTQYRLLQFVLPVVVVGEPTQRGLNAT